MRRRRHWLALALAVAASVAGAAGLPYDAAVDAHVEVRNALRAAATSHRPLLLVFGANWCEDCRALDKALNAPANAKLIAEEFDVVKIDVGDFDHNLDIDAAYGDPISAGIPAAVIVSADNRILYATRAGELADARRMSETGVHDFFARAAHAARSAH